MLFLPHPEERQPGDWDWQLPLLRRLLPLLPHLTQLRGAHLRESHLHQPRHIRLCDLPHPAGGEPSLDRGSLETSAKPHLSLDLRQRSLLRHLHGKPGYPNITTYSSVQTPFQILNMNKVKLPGSLKLPAQGYFLSSFEVKLIHTGTQNRIPPRLIVCFRSGLL